ncbi:hypothetical protein V8F06_003249 [Rhypophila decipiens]
MVSQASTQIKVMACIDDFDHSKKFLVFLACANPKVFENYVKIDPSSFSSSQTSPHPGQHFFFPPSPDNLGFYDYGYGEYYDEMMPPSPTSPDQRYGVNYPTYVTFTPPTSRFPGGPPQLRRSYPPPRPPRPPSPMIVDATYPADPFTGDQQANNAQAVNGEGKNAGNDNPIVRDVTPPPGQQTSSPQGQASTKTKARSHASKSQRSRPHKAGTKGRNPSSRQNKGENGSSACKKKTPSRLSKLSHRRRREGGGGGDRQKSMSNSSSSSASPSQAASSDFYLVDSDDTDSTSFHGSMFLPKLRARLHAALRKVHPAEAISSVGNLSHYSASVTGLV